MASLPGVLRSAAVLAATVLALAGPPAAQADVTGSGGDESAAQAYGPLASGHAVSGAFTSPSDVDYLALTVARPGETVDLTLENRTAPCADPNDAGCPIYATLMDAAGQQVGGEGSTAGTMATAGDTETVTWTFATAGTYYVLLESNGDLPSGSPAYTVTLDTPASSTSGSGSATPSPPPRPYRPAPGGAVRLQRVTRGPHTRVLTVAFAESRPAPAVTVAVRVPGSRTVLRRGLGRLGAGTHRARIAVPAALRNRLARHGSRRVLVTVALTFTGAGGARQVLTRRIALSG